MKNCKVCGGKMSDYAIADVCAECVLAEMQKESGSPTHQQMIDTELDKAIAKHPKFCGGFTAFANIENAKRVLRYARRFVEEEGFKADAILEEEKVEACEAYLEGRLEDCLVELAQCGAVVRRMMTFVQQEIDAKKAGAV